MLSFTICHIIVTIVTYYVRNNNIWLNIENNTILYTIYTIHVNNII